MFLTADILEQTKTEVNGVVDFIKTKAADLTIELGIKIITSVLIYFIGGQVIKYLVKVINIALRKAKLDMSFVKFIDSLIVTILRIALILSIVGLFTPLTPILAAFGAVGIGVGMALQGGLANFIGGILILFNKPFKIDDLIEESTYGHVGFVEDIQIFYTVLKTFDNKIVVVPNGNLANSSIINYNKQEKRRVELTFGVSYDSNIHHVKSVIEEIVNKHPKVLKGEKNIIRLAEHGQSSLKFNCYVWCAPIDYLDVKFDLLEQVKDRFDQENIEIPYPHIDVNILK